MSAWTSWKIGIGAAGMIFATRSAMVHAQHPTNVTTASTDQSSTARDAAKVLATPIDVALDGVTLREAIDVASAAARIKIAYKTEVVDAIGKRVSLHVRRVPLGDVLGDILGGTDARLVVLPGGQLAIGAGWTDRPSHARSTGTIAGTVVDSATGRRLGGATVKVEGSRISTVTVDSGRFVLQNVPVGSQIVAVRVFGYRAVERTVTVTADERTQLRIAMTPLANVLSGVVTTATGQQRRVEVGQDITRLNVDSIMQTVPVRNVTDLLETRVPGLTVTHTSGIPGAPSRLRLRGIGGGLIPTATNTSNDPIVIVDGIRVYARTSTPRDQFRFLNAAVTAQYAAPSAIDQIDPNTIETIEVFKGPSASALYGSDAANGVIVITTKKGHAGPAQLSGALDYGWTYVPGVYAQTAYYRFEHTLAVGGSTPDLCEQRNMPESFACLTDSVIPFQVLNTPRFSMFRTGANNGATVTTSGGSGSTTYSLTGSATGSLGTLKMPAYHQDLFEAFYHTSPPQWMKRPDTYKTWSGEGTVSNTPIPGVNVQFTTSLSNSDQQQSSGQSQLADLSGRYIDTTVLYTDLSGTLPGVGTNLLGTWTQRARMHTVTSNNAVSLDWSRWAVAPIHAQVGVNSRDVQSTSLTPFGIVTSDWASSSGNDTLGHFALQHTATITQTANVVATLLPIGIVRTGVGLNVNREAQSDFNGVSNKLAQGVSSPAKFQDAGQYSSALTTAGWFVEPRLNLGGRFFAAPGFRFDGGSASGAHGGANGGLFALFPKFDFSWVALDRQDSRPLWGVISLVRPRLAFGIGGVQPEPAWKLRTYQTDTTGSRFPGARVYSLGNDQLHPERSREIEGGIDVQLWGNRVELMATPYYKLRIDALQVVQLAPSAAGIAAGPYYENIGKVRNTGVEMTVTAVPVQNAAMSWTFTASLSANRNRLLVLNGSQSAVSGNGTRLVEGYPLDGRWVRPILGYTDPVAGQRIGVNNIVLGDSLAYVGSATPSYTLPFNTSMRLFHGLMGIDATVNYEHGITQINSGNTGLLYNLYYEPNASLAQQTAALAAWCAISSPCLSAGTTYGIIQTVNVVRFQSLSLSYNVPKRASQRIRIPRMSVALQGTNVGLWTSYRGKDPDVNGTPVGEALEDNGQIPPPRTWGIHVTLGN